MVRQLNSDSSPETHAILGALVEVYHVLGPGYLEAVYQEAVAIEFELRGLPYERERKIPVFYKGEQLNCTYRADFVCFGNIIVELKALDRLSGIEESQVLNYLRATGHGLALLVNFGGGRFQARRFVNSAMLQAMEDASESAVSAASVDPSGSPQPSSGTPNFPDP